MNCDKWRKQFDSSHEDHMQLQCTLCLRHLQTIAFSPLWEAIKARLPLHDHQHALIIVWHDRRVTIAKKIFVMHWLASFLNTSLIYICPFCESSQWLTAVKCQKKKIQTVHSDWLHPSCQTNHEGGFVSYEGKEFCHDPCWLYRFLYIYIYIYISTSIYELAFGYMLVFLVLFWFIFCSEK